LKSTVLHLYGKAPMLLLWPQNVTFAALPLRPVIALAINRTPARELVGYTDQGPAPTFADVPEVRTELKLTIDARTGDTLALTPGDSGLLTCTLRPGTSDAAPTSISTQATLLSITYDLQNPAKLRAICNITFLATNPDAALSLTT